MPRYNSGGMNSRGFYLVIYDQKGQNLRLFRVNLKSRSKIYGNLPDLCQNYMNCLVKRRNRKKAKRRERKQRQENPSKEMFLFLLIQKTFKGDQMADHLIISLKESKFILIWKDLTEKINRNIPSR